MPFIPRFKSLGFSGITYKTFDPEKYGMLFCPLCDGKRFIINPKRKCCPKCGGFGLTKKENGPKED